MKRIGCWSLVLCAGVVQAGPADKVYTPQVEQGEFEVEFRGGWQDEDEGYERAFVVDFGYGVTQNWFTELVVEYEGVSGQGGEVEALEWENIFALTEQGKYWADVGLFAEYEYTREDGTPDEIKIGPMFQKDIGRTQANLNLLFERQVGPNHGDETELDYTWQVKWRGNPLHEFGLQGFGGFGALDDLGEETSHKLGPALFGVNRLASGNKLGYDVAVLFGTTDETPDTTLRFELEYEIY
jgi:hypothetical protein